MRTTLKFLLPALAASLTLAACGSSSKGSGSSSQASSATPSSSQTGTAQSSSPAISAVVKTASNATLGYTVLVDAQGMTLYHLGGEQNGRVICTNSACLPSGSVSSLGKVKRPDGTEQVTYQGMPLYTFAQDQQSGDAKGQGLKDVGTWTAVRTGASASSPPSTQTTPPPRPAPPAPPSSGGGSGY